MAFFRRSDGSGHWSKDYIEHLRAIHFALIAASITTIVIASAPNALELQNAQSQLKPIKSFLETKAQLLETTTAASSVTDIPYDVRFRLGRTEYRIFVPQFVELVERNCMPGPTCVPVGTAVGTFQLSHATNLMDFAAGWDRVANFKIHRYAVVGIGTNVWSYRGFRLGYQRHPTWPIDFMDLVREPPDKKVETISLNFLEPVALSAAIRADKRYEFGNVGTPFLTETDEKAFQAILRDKDKLIDAGFYGSVRGNTHLTLPIRLVATTEVAAAHELLRRLESTWQCNGSFQKCFPDLDRVARTNDKLSITISSLAEWIDDQAAHNQPRQFEVLGVKFPEEVQSRSGIMLLIGILIYFAIQLLQLSPKTDPEYPGLDVAWIGLYSSWYSYLVTWLSVLALPLVSTFILGMSGIHYLGSLRDLYNSSLGAFLAWLVVPPIFCAVLGFICCMQIYRLAHNARFCRTAPPPDSKEVIQRSASA